MPERSSYLAGMRCWVDVSSSDVDATSLLRGSHGWDGLPPTEPEAAGYTTSPWTTRAWRAPGRTWETARRYGRDHVPRDREGVLFHALRMHSS